jgi:hypothetical protein
VKEENNLIIKTYVFIGGISVRKNIPFFILLFMVTGFIWSNAALVGAKLSKESSLPSLGIYDAIELIDFSEFIHKIDDEHLASHNNNSHIEFRRESDYVAFGADYGEQYLYTVPTNFTNHDFEFELEINYQYLNCDEVGTLQIEFLCAYSNDLLSYDALSTIAYVKLEGDHFTNETTFVVGFGIDQGGAVAFGHGKLVDLDTMPKIDILFKGSRDSSGIYLQVINNQTSETIADHTYDGFNFSVSHICIEYVTNYQNGNFNATVCNFNSIIHSYREPTVTFGKEIYYIYSIQVVLVLVLIIRKKK